MKHGGGGILFIHPGALGDVLLSLPAIRSVRAAFPGRRVLLVAGEQVGRLLRACDEVDNHLAIESGGLTHLLAGPAYLAEELRAWLARCEMAIAWTADADGSLRRALRAAGVGRIVIGSPFDQGCSGTHQADRYLETVAAVAPARSMGWTAQPPPLILAPGRPSVEYPIPLGEGEMVGIHPGSGSRHKCVRSEVLASVAVKLRGDGRRPVVIEGPADAVMVEALQTHLGAPLPVVRGLEVVELAALLPKLSLFIGHDSGLSHLAALLGVPTVVVFGPTDPRRWRPLGPRVRVVSGPSCCCPSREAVQGCVDKPCLRIPVGELWEACHERLDQPVRPIDGGEPLRTDSCHVSGPVLL